jgi:hypothetical protein
MHVVMQLVQYIGGNFEELQLVIRLNRLQVIQRSSLRITDIILDLDNFMR